MRLTIDGTELAVREGTSILTAARENRIDIPHLCSHPELSPYGGCRLCIVEVDGLPGCPAACTTLAAEGMVVRTRTAALQEMRREVLQLILSEHPATCLVCSEGAECAAFQGTIRKVGVTTGCRYCPRDGGCEIQDVAKSIGVEELSLPVSYRGLPVERDEEFYDRDYNLCIHCARCVRICQERRKTAVLSFRQRGRLTTIGPAFDMTHRDAGCEFCGACVSVCPTGALSEKNRKWSGTAAGLSPSVCTLCSLQCEVQAVVAKDRIVGTLPPGDPRDAGGDLCVKGRFCLGELANHPDRLTRPALRSPEGWEELDWDRAAASAAEKLKAIPGDRTAIYAGPDLLLEDLASIRGLADTILSTGNVTSSVFSTALGSLLSLAAASPSPQALASSRCIVSLFFNGNYGYAPATLAIKRAVERGARYYQVGWLADPTSRFATRRLLPPPGKEAGLLQGLLGAAGERAGRSAEIDEVAEALRSADGPALVLGMGIADLPGGGEILDAIEKFAKATGATVVVPSPYGNLAGLLRLLKLKPHEEVERLIAGGQIDALYLIGDCPFAERPPVRLLIYQNAFPPPPRLAPDMVLPAASWGEVSGSLAGEHGRLKTVQAAVPPPGAALQDGRILSRIAAALGGAEAAAPSAGELAALLEDRGPGPGIRVPQVPRGGSARESPAPGPPGGAPRLTLLREVNPHRFRGVSLSAYVSGMARLAPEDTLLINPRDAREMAVRDGDSVLVESAGESRTYPVMLDRKVPPAVLYLLAHPGSAAPGRDPGAVRVAKVVGDAR